MASNRMRRGSNAIVYAVVTLGAVVLVNVIAAREFVRFDLTADGIYTISEASRRLVAQLPDRLTVKAYISGELPPQVRSMSRYLRDVLFEYSAAAGGKMDVEVLDPDADKKIAKLAKQQKVRPIKLGQFSGTKTSVQLAYLGVAFQYGGKVESIPRVLSMNDLEYQISSTIRRLTRGRKLKVGFTSGHGEPSFSQGLANAKHYLRDYDVVTVDLERGEKPVPEDVDVLVMLGPRERFAERAKYEIDRFLMRGKALALFIDGMVLETPRGNFQGEQPPKIARTNDLGLRAQLRYYGLEVRPDLVMDEQNRPLPLVASGGRAMLVNYPAFPVVSDLSREHPITKNLKQLLFVFPSSVVTTKAARAGEIKVTTLARSTKKSWRQTGFFLFNPMQRPKKTDDGGPFDLALALQGRFRSFFSGRPVPKPGVARPPGEKAPSPSGNKRSPRSARLVVVGDADFLHDQWLRLNPNNLLLLLNTVDYLAQDESLIAIRAKRQTRRPLEHVDESTAGWIKYANVAGLPLVFILLGIGRWRWQLRARARRASALRRSVEARSDG